MAKVLTFYVCKDARNSNQFSFNCSTVDLILIQSAFIGYSGRYSPPSAGNLQGSCPWTRNTNNTCDALGISSANCPPQYCTCNCLHSITPVITQLCNGKNTCLFSRQLLAPSTNLCFFTREADFVVVNYTCTRRMYK